MGVAVGVLVGSGVWVAVGLVVGLGVAVPVGVAGGVLVGLGVWVAVGLIVGLGVAVPVGVAGGVLVGSGVWVAVGLIVGLGVAVPVGVAGGVLVAATVADVNAGAGCLTLAGEEARAKVESGAGIVCVRSEHAASGVTIATDTRPTIRIWRTLIINQGLFSISGIIAGIGNFGHSESDVISIGNPLSLVGPDHKPLDFPDFVDYVVWVWTLGAPRPAQGHPGGAHAHLGCSNDVCFDVVAHEEG